LSWSLSASGHTDDPETEKALAAMLGQALAQAGSAVSGASFGGSAYSGDPRELATEVPQ
jgi:hypothetical protein